MHFKVVRKWRDADANLPLKTRRNGHFSLAPLVADARIYQRSLIQ
jgi:hypothetical protein